MKFDYDELAKKFFEQFAGSLVVLTLLVFVNEYLAFVEKNRSAKTYEGAKLVCKYLLSYYSPERKIDTIELRDAEKFIDYLKKNAPLGVYNYLRNLRAMFNKGIEWNYLRSNPFAKVKLPRKQEKNPAFINSDELVKILAQTDKQYIKDIVEISFYTGLRLGEVTLLRWKNISNTNETINLGDDSFSTKTRKNRSVPIHPHIKEIIERLKNGSKNKKDDYLFKKAGNQPFTRDYVSKQFKKACRDAGIDEGVHFNSLRHSTASNMAMKGVSIFTIQKILGHTNIKTTQIYAHLQIDTLRDAINQIG